MKYYIVTITGATLGEVLEKEQIAVWELVSSKAELKPEHIRQESFRTSDNEYLTVLRIFAPVGREKAVRTILGRHFPHNFLKDTFDETSDA